MIDTSFWKAGEIQLSFLANIDKASCDEAKAVFLCLMQKKKSQIRLNLRLLAEMVGILPRAKQQPAGLIACGLRTAALFSSAPSWPQKRRQPELVPFCWRRWWDSNPRARLRTKRFRVVLVTTASIHLQVYFHGKFTICILQIGLETWNSCC